MSGFQVNNDIVPDLQLYSEIAPDFSPMQQPTLDSFYNDVEARLTMPALGSLSAPVTVPKGSFLTQDEGSRAQVTAFVSNDVTISVGSGWVLQIHNIEGGGFEQGVPFRVWTDGSATQHLTYPTASGPKDMLTAYGSAEVDATVSMALISLARRYNMLDYSDN